MVLVEFIEAIGRVADKININHYLEDGEELRSNNRTKPLAYKIEAYLILLVRVCLGSSYFNTYIKQLQKTKEAQKSMHIGVQANKYKK